MAQIHEDTEIIQVHEYSKIAQLTTTQKSFNSTVPHFVRRYQSIVLIQQTSETAEWKGVKQRRRTKSFRVIRPPLLIFLKSIFHSSFRLSCICLLTSLPCGFVYLHINVNVKRWDIRYEVLLFHRINLRGKGVHFHRDDSEKMASE